MKAALPPSLTLSQIDLAPLLIAGPKLVTTPMRAWST